MIRIILVDDHEIMRYGIHKLLEYESDIDIIGEANNGRDAIELSKELKPDIIIMDMSMHDMNGIEAARQIKKENPDIKIIALSMHSITPIVISIIKAGVSGYVLKDSSHIELLKAIRAVHLGHRYLSTAIVVQKLSTGLNRKKETGSGPLTGRENEILQLIAEGRSVKQIASSLFISPKTVASHRTNIMDKLNIRSLPLLTKYAIGAGLTSLEL